MYIIRGKQLSYSVFFKEIIRQKFLEIEENELTRYLEDLSADDFPIERYGVDHYKLLYSVLKCKTYNSEYGIRYLENLYINYYALDDKESINTLICVILGLITLVLGERFGITGFLAGLAVLFVLGVLLLINYRYAYRDSFYRHLIHNLCSELKRENSGKQELECEKNGLTNVRNDIRNRFQKIRVFVFDIDGVLTNGSVYINESGNEIKAYRMSEVDALNDLIDEGYSICAITGEDSSIVRQFERKVNWKCFVKGCKKKEQELEKIGNKLSVDLSQICYVGDGKYDISALEMAGLGVCPRNAINEAKDVADIVLHGMGGESCIYELYSMVKKVRQYTK